MILCTAKYPASQKVDVTIDYRIDIIINISIINDVTISL